MKDEDEEEWLDGARLEGGIRTAVELWCRDPPAAKAQYGPIASWDTSEITDMWMLFYGKATFNDDISRSWDVSSVTNMGRMFQGASSFTHQLGGAWSTSTADNECMFRNCPGSIAGKTNSADGTPE